jgi:hypothetical protein
MDGIDFSFVEYIQHFNSYHGTDKKYQSEHGMGIASVENEWLLVQYT